MSLQEEILRKAIKKIFVGNEESLIPSKINKLILNDEVCLSNYLIISESNIENILKYKFNLLNSCISFNERTKLFFNIIKYENSFYKKIKLFVK